MATAIWFFHVRICCSLPLKNIDWHMWHTYTNYVYLKTCIFVAGFPPLYICELITSTYDHCCLGVAWRDLANHGIRWICRSLGIVSLLSVVFLLLLCGGYEWLAFRLKTRMLWKYHPQSFGDLLYLSYLGRLKWIHQLHIFDEHWHEASQ